MSAFLILALAVGAFLAGFVASFALMLCMSDSWELRIRVRDRGWFWEKKSENP